MELEPDFAEVHADLADLAVTVAAWKQLNGLEDTTEETKEARTHAQRAIDLNPTLIQPYATMAHSYFLEGKIDTAQLWFDRAFEQVPYNASVPWRYGDFLRGQGKLLAAIEVYNRTLRISPMSFMAHFSLTIGDFSLQRYEEALEGFNYSESLTSREFPALYAPRAMTLRKLG